MMTSLISGSPRDLRFSQAILSWSLLPGGTREVLIVIAAMAAISFIVLGWAVFVRKPGRRHHHHRHHQKPPPHVGAYKEKESLSDSGSPEKEHRGKWRRRRRRDHRPRNPTLAETGGLPPVRSGPPVDSGL